MDRPQPLSSELISDLKNLRALNRFFGSYRLVRHFLRRWILPNQKRRVLDLATGSGDIPRLVVDFARNIGSQVVVDAVDFQASTIAIARELSGDYPEVTYHCADIQNFGDGANYDIVLFSLALHHFDEATATQLLRRCRELSRGQVLVADLRRGLLATLGVDLLTRTVFRQEMTRNDALASAARAFSFAELEALAISAGWENFGHRRFPFARQAIWLERP